MVRELVEERGAHAELECEKDVVVALNVKVEEDYELKKNSFGTFAYIMAFAKAIRAHRCMDPSGDISAMIQELATYVRDCPPDPSHFLEIHDLEGLGVDLLFFLDQIQVVFPELDQPKPDTPTDVVHIAETANIGDVGVPEIAL